MNQQEFRTHFPITTQKIYLNHAAISPMSTAVTEMLEWYMDERMFGGVDLYREVTAVRDKTRNRLAEMINGKAEYIAFIQNTSEGFNWLAQGLEWQAGDRIILTDYEFPANVYPFLNLEQHGVEVVYVPNREGRIELQDIADQINSRTRLLSISFVEFSNGFRNDLEAIGRLCRENDIILSVDSIQGLGAIPLDVDRFGIDFLSNGGHKWLMGPMGAGFMYIRPNLFDQLKPAFTGWLAVEDSWNFFDYRLALLPDARRFEYGTANFMGIAGLSAAVELLMQAGIENIEQHLLSLGRFMVTELPKAGMTFMGAPDERYWSGIYSFEGDRTEALFEHLMENHIVCSLRNGMLRIAPHFYNTEEEIERLVEQINTFYR